MAEDNVAGPDSRHSEAFDGAASNVYETIFDEIEDAAFLIEVERTEGDYTFTYRRTNPSHRRRTGLTGAESRGQTPGELLDDEQARELTAHYRRCVEQCETIEYEETLHLTDETSHWRTKLTPIVENGQVAQVVGVARDVTEQKESERRSQSVQRRFETVLETIQAAVFLKDTDGHYLLMNQACRTLFGIDEDESIDGLTDQELFSRERADAARNDDLRVIDTEEAIEIEETVPTEQGETVRLTRKSPVYDAEGTVEAVCGVSTDITAQKERERELERTRDRLERLNERLELAIDGANLGVWDWDMQTDDVDFNDNWATMLGYDPDEIEQRLAAWEKRVHPEDIDPVEAALDEHIADETDYYDTEHRMRTADGDWKWIRAVGRVFERDENGDPVRAVGIHIDIDGLKQVERALREERDMFTQGPAVVFKWRNEDGWPVEHVSENVEDVLGYTPEEFLSGDVPFSDVVHGDDIEQVTEEVQAHSDPETEQFSHEPYRVLTADGDVRWVLDYTKNVWEGDELTHRLGYLVDITERKQYEQTLESQRDSLEVLNQVVRHDVRNDLQIVLAYSDTLDKYVEEDGQAQLRQVIEAGQSAVDITRTAGDVTRVMLSPDGDPTAVSLRQPLVAQVKDVRTSHDHAFVSLEEAIPDVEVLADDMLESVFRNLLKNAVVHNEKTEPEIAVSATADEETVRVRVADNGPGIPDEQKNQIFEEGNTTLGSRGTGLGLYLVQTLTDRYSGDVWVENNDPRGSVFVVELARPA